MSRQARAQRVRIDLPALAIARRILKRFPHRLDLRADRVRRGSRRIERRSEQRKIRQLFLQFFRLLELTPALLQLGLSGQILLVSGLKLRLGLVERLLAVVVLDPAHPQRGVAFVELFLSLFQAALRRGIDRQILPVGALVGVVLLPVRLIGGIEIFKVRRHRVQHGRQFFCLGRFVGEPLGIGILFFLAVGGFFDAERAGDHRDRAYDRKKSGEEARQSRMPQCAPLRSHIRVIGYYTG